MIMYMIRLSHNGDVQTDPNYRKASLLKYAIAEGLFLCSTAANEVNLILDTDSATLRMSSTALNIVRLIRSTAAGKYMHHYFYDIIVLFMQNFIFFNLESALSIILYEEVSFVLSVR